MTEGTDSMRPGRQCLVEEEYTVGVPLVSINPTKHGFTLHNFIINWTSPLSIFGVIGVNFYLICQLDFSMQTE